jgi:CDK inhibitor PHO81
VGFRKILKKWDKRSKSNTKELYLSRQVEVQPCFNREFLAKLSDIIAANLLDLENGADSLLGEVDKELIDETLDHPVEFEADTYDSLDALAEVETSLSEGLQTRELHGTLEAFRRALEDTARLQDQHAEVDRILWKAVLELPEAFVEDVLRLVGGQIRWDRLDGINGRTKLHQAALAGLLPLVKACVQRGIAVGDKDAYSRTALHYATSGGHPEIASSLLNVGADPAQVDMDGNTPLLLAITEGRISCVRILLDYSSASAATIIEPLMSVSNDLIPLSLACQYGHEEVARLLLRKGAKVIPNSEGLYPQHLAAREGHPAICRLLVTEGGPGAGGKDREDKYNQWTPLFHAVLGDRPSHVECVRILVEAGVDVNAMDEYGKTALFYAAYYGVRRVSCCTVSASQQADDDFPGRSFCCSTLKPSTSCSRPARMSLPTRSSSQRKPSRR